jgi:hypothetical protein
MVSIIFRDEMVECGLAMEVGWRVWALGACWDNVARSRE